MMLQDDSTIKTGHCPPLSIITVCFNERDRIELTCESVLRQEFQHFEWIVLDGGSTDGTLPILQRYRHRMNYFASEPDRGIYHAMNKGIQQATGDYLLFLNGGDYVYEPETLAKVFSTDSPLRDDVYYGDLLLERAEGIKHYTIDFSHAYATLARRTLPHQATFIKRELFQEYGLYDESFKIAADLEFFLRVFVSSPHRKRHTISHLPLIVASYENVQGLSSRNLTLCVEDNTRARKMHYPMFYLEYAAAGRWFTRQKNRVRDSAKYRFKKFIKRDVSCRKSA